MHNWQPTRGKIMSRKKVFFLAIGLISCGIAVPTWCAGKIHYKQRKTRISAKAARPAPTAPDRIEEKYAAVNGDIFRATCADNAECFALQKTDGGMRFFCSPDGKAFLTFSGECVRGKCIKNQFPCGSGETCQPGIGCR